MPSDSKTDDPRQAATEAATEAAMIQDVQATLDDMEAHDVALTAGNLIDALDYHGIRLATAPPSGQVCVDRELLQELCNAAKTAQRRAGTITEELRLLKLVERASAALKGAAR